MESTSRAAQRTNPSTLRWGVSVAGAVLCAVATAATAEETAPSSESSAAIQSTAVGPYAALPAQLTLDKAVELFRERGFDLLLADANITQAEGNLQSSGQYANPQFNLGYGRSFGQVSLSPNYWTGGVNDNAVILDTLLVGKRRLRVEVAQAALDSTKLSRVDAERTLISTVKQQWVQAVAAKAQLDVDKEILKSNEDTEKLIGVRYTTGVLSEVDLANQKTATYEAAQQVEAATQAYEQAKTGLAFLLGARGTSAEFEVDTGLFKSQLPAPVSSATTDSLHALARDHRPDVQAQRKQVERAEASIQSAKRQVIPDFSLGLNYSQEGAGPLAVSPPTLTVDLTFTPPILYRQEGEITMAEADLRTQQVTLAKIDAQMLNDVDTAWEGLQAARKRLDRLDHGYLEQAQLARDLTKVQYEKGAASLIELLSAQRAYVTTVSEHIQTLNDLWTAIFELEAAVGTELKS